MATPTNHQPAGQPAPANATSAPTFMLFLSLCFFLIAGALAIGMLIMYSYDLSHHPQPRLAPIPNLSSFTATTLSNTTPATCNFKISLSNPNPKFNIYYNRFNVNLFYNHNNNSNNSSIVFVGGDGLGNFVQPGRGYNSLSSNVSFSTHNLGGKDVLKSYLEDQKKGSVGVIIKASYSLSFNRDDVLKVEGNFIIGMNIVYFEKSSGNKTGLGCVSGLPRDFQFYTLS